MKSTKVKFYCTGCHRWWWSNCPGTVVRCNCGIQWRLYKDHAETIDGSLSVWWELKSDAQ